MHSRTFFLLLVLLCFVAGLPNSKVNQFSNEITQLKLHELLPMQTIAPNGKRLYKLTNLDPNTSFEVRISYPATMPAFFDIEVFFEKSDDNTNRFTHRKLLNIEKTIFKTKDDASCCWYALVSAQREGKSNKKEIEEQEIVFNITVEKLYFGFITFESMKLAGFGVCGLLFIILISTKFTQYLVQLSSPDKDTDAYEQDRTSAAASHGYATAKQHSL